MHRAYDREPELRLLVAQGVTAGEYCSRLLHSGAGRGKNLAEHFDRQRLWEGGTDIFEKTILISHEGGFGDAIQFCRYVKLVAEMGAHVIPELSLARGRRADLVALTRQGDIWIIEVKSSIEDFKVDRKWPDYRLHSDRFFFATHPGVPAEIFPGECGFILSDGYGAEILREAPEHRMAAATRKALMLRMARAGAARLLAAELAGVAVPVIEGESE